MYYIYLLVDPDKPEKTKVGITKNPKQRIRTYRTAAPECYFESTYIVPDKTHERRILEELRSVFWVDREYVHCNYKLVKNIIEGYLHDNNI